MKKLARFPIRPLSRIPDAAPRAARQASLLDLLNARAPAPIQRSSLPLQREGDDDEPQPQLQQTDMPRVFEELSFPYQSHYRTTSFLGEEDIDKTCETMWNTLIGIKRKELRKSIRSPSRALVEAAVKSLSPAEAQSLLVHEADELAKQVISLPVGDVEPFIHFAREEGWGKELTSEIIPFEVPRIGRGIIEFFHIGESKDTLLFASHGFQKGRGLTGCTPQIERTYAFMSKAGVSVTRNTVSEETYTQLYEQMQADLEKFRLPGVPDLAVIPHRAYDVLAEERNLLAAAAKKMDIAIFRDWAWAEGEEAKPYVIAYVNTVPFDFLMQQRLLNQYPHHLMQVCRADWSKDAGVAGGRERSEPVLSAW